MLKFLCKDLWISLWERQVDNLRTNHRVRNAHLSPPPPLPNSPSLVGSTVLSSFPSAWLHHHPEHVSTCGSSQTNVLISVWTGCLRTASQLLPTPAVSGHLLLLLCLCNALWSSCPTAPQLRCWNCPGRSIPLGSTSYSQCGHPSAPYSTHGTSTPGPE